MPQGYDTCFFHGCGVLMALQPEELSEGQEAFRGFRGLWGFKIVGFGV